MAIEVKFKKHVEEYRPKHSMVNSWVFEYNPKDDRDHNQYSSFVQTQAECELADAMANVAEVNGLSTNDLQHLFPAVLRMLKSNSPWAK